jgi:hypothetical protein
MAKQAKIPMVTVLRVKTLPPDQKTLTAILDNKEYPLDRITRLLDFVTNRDAQVVNFSTVFGHQFPFAPGDYASFSVMLEPRSDHIKPRGPTECDGEEHND